MTPILIIPGVLCTSEIFAPQIGGLWRHGPVTIASTLCGTTVGDVASGTLATAPPKFALAGISMGGHIAFEVIRQAPHRVTRLALLDTSARQDTAEQEARRRLLLARARAEDFEQLLREVMPLMLHPARQSDQGLIEVLVRMGLSVGVSGLATHTQIVLSRPDSLATLRHIAVPTLVVVGENDGLAPPELSEEIAAGIASARLVRVESCGHASPLEAPDIVSAALNDWLLA